MCRTSRDAVATLLVVVLVTATARALGPGCCSRTNGSCKKSCEQISLVNIAINQEERNRSIKHLRHSCPDPSLQEDFWTCMNSTLSEIRRGDSWLGRPCCRLPQSERCRLSCIQATAIHNLSSSCRRSDEVVFYNCIEKMKAGEECCRGGLTPECRQACKDLFTSVGSPSRQARTAAIKTCKAQQSPHVVQCISNYTPMTPAVNPTRNLFCCDKSQSSECRMRCRSILRTYTTQEEILDSLSQRGCDSPLPQNQLWQCLLSNSDAVKTSSRTTVNSEDLGMDSAKLQCCFRASTVDCQRLCMEIFDKDREHIRSKFDWRCKFSPVESDMLHCLREEDEPCELGCDGLKYCSNFNYRPVELFRSCDSSSDQAASREVQIWEKGEIKLPRMTIPVLNISECQPHVWKAIACALQIKPCPRQSYVNTICKSDCISILEKCLDKGRLVDKRTPESICEILSPQGNNNASCISIAPYLVASRNPVVASEVSHPCKPNPCRKGDVCLVNRNCLIGQPCSPYTCVLGCRMGDVSRLIVPTQSYIRVPRSRHGHQERCYKVCYCNHQGDLEDCVSQPCISTNDSCWADNKKIPHNTRFTMGCNICFCYAGELTCTKRHCNSGLPCYCPDHYVPVCGANGKTYPSACLARCAGLTDDQFEFGACFDSDPCSPNSCHPYDRCVPRKRVCLSIRHRSCKQYDCVSTQPNCNLQPKFNVCDTENVEHLNLCWMFQKKKSLAHFGQCMHHCRSRGPVCGHNGETYDSECAAWAERVSVDYKGPCVAVSFSDGAHSRCSGIKCPPFPSEHCTKVFPPGGCCPICGAALRLLYSQKLADWSVEAVRSVEPVVLQTIAEKLRNHVKVAECDVFAYLSLESGIIVLVSATADSPTPLQVEACIREAEKLETLIQQGSPTLLTELPLSFVTTATMIQPVTDDGAPRQVAPSAVVITVLVAMVTTSR